MRVALNSIATLKLRSGFTSECESPTASGRTPPKTEDSTAESFNWVYEIIALLTYKPGVQFGFLAKESGVLEFTVTMDVLDATDPERKRRTTITIRDRVHEMNFNILSQRAREWAIVDTFAKLVHRIEQHEANEWLRFDGQHVIDPHPRG